MTVKTAVIGLGFIGMVHIEALKRLNGVEVVAVMGSTAEKTKRKAKELGISKCFSDYLTLLKDPDIEAVHICTPNHMHYEMAKKALLAGKHVICEKPLTISIEEAEDLNKLATSSELIHAVCFNIRYYPMLQQLKEMIRQGELGRIYAVNGSYLQDWLLFDSDYNWRVESAYSGKSRAVADVGSHWMDLLESVTGLGITEVMADFSTVHKTRKKPLEAAETYAAIVNSEASRYQEVPIDTEDYANILFRMGNGVRGSFTVSQVHAGRKNRLYIEIAGTRQSASFDSEHPNYLWIGNRDGNNQVMIKDTSLLHPEARRYADYPGGHNEGYPDTFKQLFKDIYHAMASNEYRDGISYPSFTDGLREQTLCESINKSQHERKWIAVL
ncbi:Gfo/Idh/MocA family oxidoreductase [Paenibacillus sp. J5C_2022]|uniref:Gfo/Idh/MocA family protein n=1 Tax=Paenibacillus sp. J5C2022 TaxID=2977129 RepID=UPI0021CFE093|nr:Gfo/Idh/MocA family oxidoreductase [Paenibacillus sp. J5C2022]MCU6710740.1 Gfo/Idh/MocA family oxidoreductase [Paenibacillus sp. J5C2022]